MTILTEAIEDLAVQQHALVTWKQLAASGLHDRQILGLVRSRRIRKVRPRVYAVVGAPTTREQEVLAVVLYAGDGALASHATAAELWDFARRPPRRIEVTVPGDLRPRLKGVGLHRSVVIADEDRAVVRDVPCTSFERTVCDTTTVLSETQLGRVVDDGLRRGVTTLGRLHACVERLDSGPNRRLTVVQRILAQRGVGYHPGGSAEELSLLDVLRRAGLPLPLQQHEVEAGGRRYVLDFAWPQLRVFAEWYGLPWHTGAAAVAADSDRISDLAAAGWTPLIFTDQNSATEIVARTERALVKAAEVWALTYHQSA